jgi:hypothetical protein
VDAPSIEILFVVSGKDIDLLPLAISGALDSTQFHSVRSLTLICPRIDIREMKKIADSIDYPIKVVAEDEIIEGKHSTRLAEIFGGRSGWVLQQLLKIYYVADSEAKGVLIVDADTILLRNRVWIDFEMSQVLMPTWERHTPYYEFLKRNSFQCQDETVSHISHHMLFQPVIVREMLRRYSLVNVSSTVDLLTLFKGFGNSPFSIDYEMYAQYLLAEYPGLIRYEKWANYSVNNISTVNLEDERWKKRFSSISAHAYNLR